MISTTNRFKKNFVQRKRFERGVSKARHQMQHMSVKLIEEIRMQLPGASESTVVNWPDEHSI
jgi:hypothetical protein